MSKEKSPRFYVISGILGNIQDISPNMVEKILDTEVLFVEEIQEVLECFHTLDIKYKGKLIQMGKKISEQDKKEILENFLLKKNIGIFEIGGTACFQDPGQDIVDFIYKIGVKYGSGFEVIPVPGSSALTTAISVCGITVRSFFFGGLMLDGDLEENIQALKVPSIFFLVPNDFKKALAMVSFMESTDDKQAFIGMNMGKSFGPPYEKYENVLFKGTYQSVYRQLHDFYHHIEQDGFQGGFQFVVVFDYKKVSN